jgi:hypothetical protein
MKDTIDDALALWSIGRTVALAMGRDYALRYAQNGLNTPFVRDNFLAGVADKPIVIPVEA